MKWYSCGPTVYDDAHLGHARNYVSADIIRRILTHFFGFNVTYVQNVTDVEDKVCSCSHLFAIFEKTNPLALDHT